MKLKVKDIISHAGRDWMVEGVVTYQLDGRVLPLARAVDGAEVRWVEPLLDDLDDRVLIFSEVADLNVSTPPPASISYQGRSYIPRFSGTAAVSLEGRLPGRVSGTCEVWRYRASGDVFLQIERWPDGLVFLAGESVHQGMLDVLPGSAS